MSLKKYFKSFEVMQQHKGQVFIEYFILLCVMAALTILATSVFHKNVVNKIGEYSDSAIEKIAPGFDGYDKNL